MWDEKWKIEKKQKGEEWELWLWILLFLPKNE